MSKNDVAQGTTVPDTNGETWESNEAMRKRGKTDPVNDLARKQKKRKEKKKEKEQSDQVHHSQTSAPYDMPTGHESVDRLHRDDRPQHRFHRSRRVTPAQQCVADVMHMATAVEHGPCMSKVHTVCRECPMQVHTHLCEYTWHVVMRSSGENVYCNKQMMMLKL